MYPLKTVAINTIREILLFFFIYLFFKSIVTNGINSDNNLFGRN